MSTASARAAAAAAPRPIATETWAPASAGASLTPSPSISTPLSARGEPGRLGELVLRRESGEMVRDPERGGGAFDRAGGIAGDDGGLDSARTEPLDQSSCAGVQGVGEGETGEQDPFPGEEDAGSTVIGLVAPVAAAFAVPIATGVSVASAAPVILAPGAGTAAGRRRFRSRGSSEGFRPPDAPDIPAASRGGMNFVSTGPGDVLRAAHGVANAADPARDTAGMRAGVLHHGIGAVRLRIGSLRPGSEAACIRAGGSCPESGAVTFRSVRPRRASGHTGWCNGFLSPPDAVRRRDDRRGRGMRGVALQGRRKRKASRLGDAGKGRYRPQAEPSLGEGAGLVGEAVGGEREPARPRSRGWR